MAEDEGPLGVVVLLLAFLPLEAHPPLLSGSYLRQSSWALLGRGRRGALCQLLGPRRLHCGGGGGLVRRPLALPQCCIPSCLCSGVAGRRIEAAFLQKPGDF